MESNIVIFLNQLGMGKFGWATSFFNEINFLVFLWLGITILILIFDKKNGKKVALAVILAIGLHFLFSEYFFKHVLFERMRPWLAFPGDIFPVGKKYSDSSFPSGHMSSSLAVLAVYLYYYRRKAVWVVALFVVIFMAFSRMHNGMHYPTDVLTGTGLGILYALIAVKVSGKILKNY